LLYKTCIAITKRERYIYVFFNDMYIT